MTVFRCKRSGNTVSFTNENDIDQLRVHEGYEEVKDEKETTHADEDAGQDAKEEVLKPDASIPMENMPLRHNGKVDKRSLAYRKMMGRS